MLVQLGCGTMASLASLVSLGSGAASTCPFQGNLLNTRRVSFSRGQLWDAQKRWHRVSFCKYSFTTTAFLPKQGNAVFVDVGTYKVSGNVAAAAADDEVVLKTAPKPVLRSPGPNSTTWDTSRTRRDAGDEKLVDSEDRNSMLESLGEVLEKAEKLGISKAIVLGSSKKSGVPVNKSIPMNATELPLVVPGRPNRYKPKPLHSRADLRPQNPKESKRRVWRKGDSVSSVQKVVKVSPMVDSTIEKEETKAGKGEVESQPQPTVSLKPALPLRRPELKLQARPTITHLPILKKPVILNDVGATAKPPFDETNTDANTRKRKPILKDVGAAAGAKSPFDETKADANTRKCKPILKDVGAAAGAKSPFDETNADANTRKRKPILKDVGAAAGAKSLVIKEADSAIKAKEQEPILIDKFATKNPMADPSFAQAGGAPQKPGKSSFSGKFKDAPNWRNVPARGTRRQMFDDKNPKGETGARKGRKWNKASRRAAKLQAAREAAPVRVEILEVGKKGMLIEDLAYSLAINVGEIYGTLFSKGIRPEGVQTVDGDMVKMICEQYGVEVIDADPSRLEELAKKKEIFDEEDLDNLEGRPPVLTIMGHVDHGKTTLLDHIRKSKVAASEAGGITQGIGAYKVLVPVDGKLQPCVFLDTPGHEAFGAMRARGARVTDIAIIVVAADDGIRPQTKEAIAHAKAAGVPIVIAINKIDKDGASPERVMQELASIGLMPEEWGGDIQMVQISALKGDNVDDLLEIVMLVAELEDLKANPHRNAKGTVIEAGLHKSKGSVATFIVQNGTLKRGDIVVCGEAYGKMRALYDDAGKQIAEAGPSMPVQVIGLNNVPIAGDEFEVVDSLNIAREKAESRAELLRNERILAKAEDGKVTLFSLASAISSKEMSGLDLHQLNIIMKVDVQGSIEAIRQALQVLPQDNVTLKFLLEATGDVNTSDVDLAVVSKAIIFGFNTKVPGAVKKYADNKGVEIRLYRVIYELIDEVRNAMEGLLDPVEEQIPIGSAEVRAVFSSGSGRAAGCMVLEGKVAKGCGIRVRRKGKEIYVGILDSLRRVREIVKEVNAGLECGIAIEDYTDWEVGDTIEAFNTAQKKRTLEEASATMTAVLEEGRVKL